MTCNNNNWCSIYIAPGVIFYEDSPDVIVDTITATYENSLGNEGDREYIMTILFQKSVSTGVVTISGNID